MQIYLQAALVTENEYFKHRGWLYRVGNDAQAQQQAQDNNPVNNSE